VKLPFREEGKPSRTILGAALEEVFDELCDRKQAVLLATPYLHCESRFLERAGPELRVRATMSRDAVKHALAQHPLRLRFGWALTFFSGPTRILRYVQDEDRRYLRIELPPSLVVDEQRQSLRIDRVGRSSGALGSEDGTLLRISLENLSARGAGVFCLEAIPPGKFPTGRTLDLSLSLEGGPVLRCRAKLCHGSGQSLGLAFQPPLDGRDLQRVLEWLWPKEEEARRHWENRAELRARAEQLARPKVSPSGVLLLSSRAGLAAQVASALEELLPLRVVTPAMAPFKEAAASPPLLLLVDARTEGMEGRYRLRTLLETVAIGAPVMVLGSSEDPQGGRLLAAEVKATSYVEWNPQQGVFFRRLLQGLIQHHWREDPPT
jgi:hypothetical protein